MPPTANQDVFVHEFVSRIYELFGTSLEQFESLRVQVEIISGAGIARLVNVWDEHLSSGFSKAVILGDKPEGENPYKSLVRAMKEELGYISALDL